MPNTPTVKPDQHGTSDDKPNTLDDPYKDERPQDALARLSSGETSNAGEGFIVYKTYYNDNEGVRQEKVHGPMPVGEWADYSRKNGL
jgi:hypothetical protein